MVVTCFWMTRPLAVVVVVVSFTTVPLGWVVVLVFVVVEVWLVVTGEGGTTTGAGVGAEEEHPATNPQIATIKAKPASLRTDFIR